MNNDDFPALGSTQFRSAPKQAAAPKRGSWGPMAAPKQAAPKAETATAQLSKAAAAAAPKTESAKTTEASVSAGSGRGGGGAGGGGSGSSRGQGGARGGGRGGRGGHGRGAARGGGGGGGGGRGGCFICGSTDHMKRDCPSASSGSSGSGGSGAGAGSGVAAGGARGESKGEHKHDSKEMFVDTHVHIDYILQDMRKKFDDVKKLFPPQLEAMVNVFCDPSAFAPSLATYPDLLKDKLVYAAMGLHPHHAKSYDEKMEARIIEAVKSQLSSGKIVAWGETGLDYAKKESPPDVQRAVFRKQIARAVEFKLPLVVHSRAAEKDTYDILAECAPKDMRIHIHCFNDSAELAKKIMDFFPNAFFGFTGVVTFASAGKLQDVVRTTIPLDRLLLETDGPYMVPAASKATCRTCHSGLIPEIAATIAQLKKVSVDEVYKAARANTKKMYGI